jgi:hypothetical protein
MHQKIHDYPFPGLAFRTAIPFVMKQERNIKYQQYEHHHPIHSLEKPTRWLTRCHSGGMEFLRPLLEEGFRP